MARLSLLLLFLLTLPTWAAAGDVPCDCGDSSDGGRLPSWNVGTASLLRLFPTSDIYPPYAADPHRPSNAVLVAFFPEVGVPDATDVRTALRAGGRIGLLRIQPEIYEGLSWQLSIEAGMDGEYDSYNKLDNVGWDGNYGLTLTMATDGPFSAKIAALHVSSHVGDEYAERTGRQRIGYTREELALGLAVGHAPGLRVYVEGGDAFHMLSALQKRLRGQAGIEFESKRTLLGGRFGWYLATDVQTMEERDWRVDASVHIGLATRSEGRAWKVGLEAYRGRPPLGEFFQYTESHVAFGLWIDL